MIRTIRFPFMAFIPLLLILGLSACTESTEPVSDPGDRLAIQGSGTVDPGAGTFVLKTFETPALNGGQPGLVQLVGSNMIVLPDSGAVSIDVALRNLSHGPVYAPAVVWLSDFTPSGLLVLNPDLMIGLPGSATNGDDAFSQYGFDYSEFFGEDGFLGPQETSEPKTWSFGNYNGNSFSFASRAEFGLAPDLPRIAGLSWMDNNGNGTVDPDEQPVGFGFVNVLFPDGHVAGIMVGPDGRYSLPVQEAGLYELHFDPLIDTFAPIAFSTPNPLDVLLVPGPTGQITSFLDANFGIVNNLPSWNIIQFTNLSPDSLQIGGFELIDAYLESPVSLAMQVAFSGCAPDEPFSLFMTGGFMESIPVQANIVLRKDYESECEAFWTTDIRFDLSPLIDRFIGIYGPGALILNITDFSGETRHVQLDLYPPVGGGDLAGVN